MNLRAVIIAFKAPKIGLVTELWVPPPQQSSVYDLFSAAFPSFHYCSGSQHCYLRRGCNSEVLSYQFL